MLLRRALFVAHNATGSQQGISRFPICPHQIDPQFADQTSKSVNPIAKRAVNGMEAELAATRAGGRSKRPADNESAPLDRLPNLDNSAASKAIRTRARDLARQFCVRLVFVKPSRQFNMAIEDDGLG
jgi:hypothetical protein